MAKKEKEKSVVKIDDKEYDVESLTDEQKAMVNHILDLDRKLQSSEFIWQTSVFGCFKSVTR